MDTTPLELDVDARIASILPELIAIRHDLHTHPELGYKEKRTSKVIQTYLDAIPLQYVSGLAKGTGVLAYLAGSGSKAIGLRADIDALPITEANTFAWKSIHNGCMHACGHDGHTTILLGAAKVLGSIAKERTLPNPITFVFQPAEEGGAGGREMVHDGCLDGSCLGSPVGKMFGLHGWPQLPLHHVATRPGPMLAADIAVRITIQGTGGHAAFPHLGRDPILCAAHVITAVQQVVSRHVDPLDALVVSLTQIHGGTTHNIIPGEVTIIGTIRYLEQSTGEMAKLRMKEIVESIAKAHDCKGVVALTDGYPVTRNDPNAVQTFFDIANATIDPTRVLTFEHPVMGGEDFSYYCNKVPSCFFALGLLPDGIDAIAGLHQPTFDFNDEAIATGIKLFCALALHAVVD